MKVIRWLGNPYVFISLFLLMIIEGDNFGGFFLLYLFLALPHAALYAIVSVIGIVVLIAGTEIKQKRLKQVLTITGVATMITGVTIFFRRGHSYETFITAVPLISLFITGISCACLVVYFLLGDPKTSIE